MKIYEYKELVIEWFIEQFDNISFKIYNIKTGFSNLYKWLPIMWNDRWYDYSYIYSILEFKLQIMRDNWEHNTHYENSEEEYKTLNQLLEDIKLLQNDEWAIEENKLHNLKYGDIEFVNKVENENGSISGILERSKVTNEEERLQEVENMRRIYQLEAEEKEIVKNRFFNILNDNIEKFWD